MMVRLLVLGAALTVLSACDAKVVAAHLGHGGSGADMHAPPAAGQANGADPGSINLQPGQDAWKASPYIKQYYELTRTSLAGGADAADFEAYRDASYEIFKAFGREQGGEAGAAGMLDHLKDIPAQVVGIVREDPSVLDSYDAFWLALVGPP